MKEENHTKTLHKRENVQSNNLIVEVATSTGTAIGFSLVGNISCCHGIFGAILTNDGWVPSLNRNVMLLQLVLLEISQPEIALRASAFAAGLRTGKLRFLVDLPHVGDVVR